MDPRKNIPTRKLPPRSAANPIESLESRQLLSANIVVMPALTAMPAAAGAAVSGFTPAQIRHAYGFDTVKFSGVAGDGTGQTIAIVDAYNDPNIAADLATFDAKFSLPAPPSFIKLNQKGGAVTSVPTNAGWAGEIALDVEWAHAIAPKAKLILVEANSSNLSDLLAAVDTARKQAGVSVISMSWGGGEFLGQKSDDSYFTTPTGHTPETFVAASGDDGSFGGAEWPASSPNVLSVGGTSLYTNDSAGTYGSESPWSESSGGFSRIEARPAYQAKAQTSASRAAPDVSYNANPNTGFAVYDSIPYGRVSGWQVIGGTSAGTPQWAALVAIADQGRALLHKAALDGSSNTLPALYGVYTASTYLTTFNDITGGGGFRAFYSHAHQGYDEVTGLGTPDAAKVINILLSIGAVTTTVKPAAQGTGSTSGGSTSSSTSSSGSAHPSIQHLPPPKDNDGEAGDTVTTPTNTAATATPATATTAITAAQTSATASHAVDGAASASPIGVPAPINVVSSSNVAIDSSGFAIRATAVASTQFAFSAGSATSLVARAMMADIATVGQWTRTITGSPVEASDSPQSGSSVVTLSEPVGAVATILAVNTTAAARAFFHLAPIDAQGLFGDALAAFARQSAEIAFPASLAQATPSNTRAWAITAGVIAADAMLLGYWYTKRRKVARAAAMYDGVFHDGEPVRRGA